MRIKEMIIKDEMSRSFLQILPTEYHKKYMMNSEEKMHADIGA